MDTLPVCLESIILSYKKDLEDTEKTFNNFKNVLTEIKNISHTMGYDSDDEFYSIIIFNNLHHQYLLRPTFAGYLMFDHFSYSPEEIDFLNSDYDSDSSSSEESDISD